MHTARHFRAIHGRIPALRKVPCLLRDVFGSACSDKCHARAPSASPREARPEHAICCLQEALQRRKLRRSNLQNHMTVVHSPSVFLYTRTDVSRMQILFFQSSLRLVIRRGY